MYLGYCGSRGSLLRRTEEVVDNTPTLSQTIVHDTIGGGAVFQHADRYRTLQLDDVDTLCLRGLKYDTALRMVWATRKQNKGIEVGKDWMIGNDKLNLYRNQLITGRMEIRRKWDDLIELF